MSDLVTVTFLINDNTGEEKFVENLPQDYQFQPGERSVTREITQEEFDLLFHNLGEKLKIFRYVDEASLYDKYIPPKGLNYKTGLTTRLHPKHYIKKDGWLEKTEFYANISYNSTIKDWEYSDKIICANFTYTIDPVTEYAISRVKVVDYHKENGELHPDKKVMVKVYSVLEMDEVAIKRRSNVISLIKIEIAKFAAWLLSVQYPDPNTRPNSNDVSKALMAPLNIPILNYINGGDRSIIQIIKYANDEFFDIMMPEYGKTVRDHIVDWMEEHA